jgi:RNA polymerase sigma factor (sigma-70 family)
MGLLMLESVLQRAATGDADAFGLIVRRFQDMAVGYAFSILGDFQLAEDAAQEAFVQAYQDLWQLRDPRAFPAWFRRLIFKQCDRLTRKKRLQVVPLEAAAAIASGAPDPFEAVEMREAKDRVHEAIRCLADHERVVMTLFYIGEYSQKEIGAFLDVPVTTVKKRLYDARKHLKERMVAMVHDNLQDNRPSRDEQFVKQVFVLVVDDQPLIVDLIRINLQKAGYEVITAFDGDEGLRKAREEQPDLMILDVIMPRRDGFEVLREIRQQPETRELPVILLTVKSQDQDIFEEAKEGTAMYLPKPFHPTELMSLVQGALAARP